VCGDEISTSSGHIGRQSQRWLPPQCLETVTMKYFTFSPVTSGKFVKKSDNFLSTFRKIIIFRVEKSISVSITFTELTTTTTSKKEKRVVVSKATYTAQQHIS
jgi:hypothetical protein